MTVEKWGQSPFTHETVFVKFISDLLRSLFPEFHSPFLFAQGRAPYKAADEGVLSGVRLLGTGL